MLYILLTSLVLPVACVRGGPETQTNESASSRNSNQHNTGEGRVQIEVPRQLGPIESNSSQDAIAVVTISQEGEVSLNSEYLGKDLGRLDNQLKPRLDELFKDKPKEKRDVHIKAAKDLSYAQIVKVIDAVRASGDFTIKVD